MGIIIRNPFLTLPIIKPVLLTNEILVGRIFNPPTIQKRYGIHLLSKYNIIIDSLISIHAPRKQ